MWGLAHQRLAHRARPAQPLLGPDERDTRALRGTVVLVDDRPPPPLDHLALDVRWAGRRRVHHAPQRRQVELITHRLGQPQHPHEHGGDELRMGDAVSFDALEHLDRIEPLHHHGGRSGRLGAHGPHGRSGVVKRCGTEIHRLGVHAERLEHRCRHCRVTGRRQRPADAFRTTGAAGRILQQLAVDSAVDRLGPNAGDTVGIAAPAQ